MDMCKIGLGYNAVPPPYTGNFMPPKPDLVYPSLDDFIDVNEFVSESVVEKPTVESMNLRMKPVEQIRQDTYKSPKGNKRNRNQQMSQKLGSYFEMFNKACHVCGSFDHLQNDCNNWYNKERFAKPVWNHNQRVNHKNFAKNTHPCPKRNIVSIAVLMKSGIKSINAARQTSSKAAVTVNTARPVNIAHPKTIMNAAKSRSYFSSLALSIVKRPIQNRTTSKNSKINQKVNTARTKAVFNVVQGNHVNTVKASARWVWRLKHKVLNHVSRNNSASITFKRFDYVDAQADPTQHMTGNKSFLIDYEEINGGFVAFGDLRVKMIRCDNGTEFNNRVMNQFCEIKGIKREFSVARTLQQNGVAERKNKTLIEAARAMLADSKLPTTFWVEAVNTACKFDRKADEGFFIGYFTNSKAFRVFNSRTRIVEDNLHVKFSENTANITQDLPFSSSLKDSPGACYKPKGEKEKKDTKDPGNEDSKAPITKEKRVNQEKDSVNRTNRVNDVSSTVNATSNEVNAIGRKSSIELPDYLNMPELEDISIFEDSNKDVFGAEADLNNLESTFQVSPIPITRIHKDYPLQQVIGDLHSASQTGECSNWVYRNKMDERGIVIRNKARKIEEEVYVCQPLGFEDSDFLDKVYKVEKKEDGIFINQDKYVNHILNKFGYSDVKTTSTPMETHKTLFKDEKGEDVDGQLYRSIIGSLMYLTSSRPAIMFAVCAYRKSTTGGCQFLGCRLISWQCKKPTVVANSTTEAEYLAASNCCG
nr:hypothetical protein [Tanacetum cinerariifolium]